MFAPGQAAGGYDLTKRSIAQSWMSDGPPPQHQALTPVRKLVTADTERRIRKPTVSQNSSNETKAGGCGGRTWLLQVLIWGCAKHLWAEIESSIRKEADVRGQPRHLHLHRRHDFVRAVYEVDDVAPKNIETKLRALSRCPAEVLSIVIATTDPKYRMKKVAGKGKTTSRQMEALKASIRGNYKRRVANYTHDIIIHGADNEETHTMHMERLIGSTRVETTECSAINGWACAADAARDRNLLSSDWIVVGSSTLEGLSGRQGNTMDLTVRPSARMQLFPSKGDAQMLAPNVQIVGSNWMIPRWMQVVHSQTMSDTSLLDDARWYDWTHGAMRVKHVRPELAILRKHMTKRPKDLVHLDTLCAHPFAYDQSLLRDAARLVAAEMSPEHRKDLIGVTKGNPCPM